MVSKSSATINTATFELHLIPEQLEKHLKEWTQGSAVTEEIAKLNIESLTAEQLNERIHPKNPIQTGGWWTAGVNWRTGLPMGTRYGQAKPDQPHELGEGKAAKYLTASGMQPDAIFLAMPDQNYWLDIWADKKQPILITEGVKKAAAGLSLGFPTIAITGVWNWGKDGKLAPELEKWAQSGREIILCFDSDYQEKTSCLFALHKLGTLLKDKGCKVKIALWEEHKGMDDFIVAEGSDAFKFVIANAETLKRWEAQLVKPHRTNRHRLPKHSIISGELTEKYQGRLAWLERLQSWVRYGAEQEGKWTIESPEVIKQVILAELRSRPETATEGLTAGYIRGVYDILQLDLFVKDWDEPLGLIPLQDGVLNIASGELLPHSPGYHFLWQLPYRWGDRILSCEPILNWLSEATKGDTQMIALLRAYMKAVVLGRTDLQRFLELQGPGGTGKGTFIRLLEALVGEDNCESTTLSALEGRFETIALVNKKLVTITDSTRYGGEVATLKALTGGDRIRLEEKNISRRKTPSVRARCMILIAANEPIQSSDYTSGLERRRLTVPFLNKVSPEKRRDLDREFKPYLPALLHWVLSMPDEDMEKLLRDTSANCQSLARYRLEMLLDTNPLADWFDACVVLDSNGKTYVGTLNDVDRLYQSYQSYVTSTGNSPVSSRRFSNLLQDLTVNQLGLSNIHKCRDRGGAYFPGIILRSNGSHPRPITELISMDEVTGVTDKSSPGDGLVTGESIGSDGCDGCDVLIETSQKNAFKSDRIEKTQIEGLTPPQSVNPSQPVVDPLHGWDEMHEDRPYPNPKSDNIRSSQKRALAIREKALAAKTKQDLSALRRENGGQFSNHELLWVQNWLMNFFPAEYDYLIATSKVIQPSLLD